MIISRVARKWQVITIFLISHTIIPNFTTIWIYEQDFKITIGNHWLLKIFFLYIRYRPCRNTCYNHKIQTLTISIYWLHIIITHIFIVNSLVVSSILSRDDEDIWNNVPPQSPWQITWNVTTKGVANGTAISCNSV